MLLVFILLILVLTILIFSIRIKFIVKVKNEKSIVFVKWYMLKKICLYSNNLENAIKKKNKSNIDTRNNKEKNKKILLKIIKNKKFDLEQFKLKVDVCSTDPIVTSFLVASIGSVIGIFIKLLNFNVNSKEFYYKINPIYTNEKILNIKLKCIISVNLVHIIFVIFRSIIDWRRDENGR